MARVTFTHDDSDDETSITFDASCWVDITRRYFDFLRGCGFVINTQDFADTVTTQVTELRDAEKRFSVGVLVDVGGGGFISGDDNV